MLIIIIILNFSVYHIV